VWRLRVAKRRANSTHQRAFDQHDTLQVRDHTRGVPLIIVNIAVLELAVCAADQLKAGMLRGPANRPRCLLQARPPVITNTQAVCTGCSAADQDVAGMGN